MTYLYQVENVVPVALSTDGGLTFNVIANIAAASEDHARPRRAGDSRGLFRFVDQPTITAGQGEVWVVFNAGGPMFATGAPVTGLGQVGAFFAGEVVPGTNNCTYGDIAIGPAGQVMQVCALTESGQGGGKLFVNVDPDGLGPAGFGDRVFVAATHVGGFDFIPPQPDRSVDAEPGLAWDRTGGAAQRPRVPRLHRGAAERERRHRHLRALLRRRRRHLERRRAGERRPDGQQPVPAQDLARSDHREPRGRLVRLAGGPRHRRSQATPTASPTTTRSSGARSAPTAARRSRRTSRSARGHRTRTTPATASTTATTAGCRSSAASPIPRGRTTPTAPATNPDGALHQLDIYTAAVLTT